VTAPSDSKNTHADRRLPVSHGHFDRELWCTTAHLAKAERHQGAQRTNLPIAHSSRIGETNESHLGKERQLERVIGSLHAAFDTAADLRAKYVAILTGIQKQTSTLLNLSPGKPCVAASVGPNGW
jgi:hypothetical protein